MASSTSSAQFRITPPGYSGKLNLASVSKAFFFGHKTTAFYPKLRAKSMGSLLRAVNEKVDGIDLGTTNSAMEVLKKNDTVTYGSESGADFPPNSLSLKHGPFQCHNFQKGDALPWSLGLETLGGVMTKIIPRNTTLPTSTTLEVFSTGADGQTSVVINVFLGEREFVRDNAYVGSLRLDGIPPAPRGVPQIEVKFQFHLIGILSVTAVDKGARKVRGTFIDLSNVYHMQRMINEAESYSMDYQEKGDAIDTKNQAESVVYQTEKQLKELGETRFLPQKEKVGPLLRAVIEEIDLKTSIQTFHWVPSIFCNAKYLPPLHILF